jgi:hypothetical protein
MIAQSTYSAADRDRMRQLLVDLDVYLFDGNDMEQTLARHPPRAAIPMLDSLKAAFPVSVAFDSRGLQECTRDYLRLPPG